MQKVEDEARDIARTTEVIAQYAGRRPRGWLGPGLTETWETPDLSLRRVMSTFAIGC